MSCSKDKANGLICVELKYCERCGDLWLRESGSQEVYCGKCQTSVEDLPIPRKKPARVSLPVRRKTVIDKYGNSEDDSLDLKAAGGVA